MIQYRVNYMKNGNVKEGGCYDTVEEAKAQAKKFAANKLPVEVKEVIVVEKRITNCGQWTFGDSRWFVSQWTEKKMRGYWLYTWLDFPKELRDSGLFNANAEKLRSKSKLNEKELTEAMMQMWAEL